MQIRDLKTYFYTSEGIARAVDGVSYDVNETETLAIVGESGSGKSVTAMSVLKLIRHPGKIVGGEIIFRGHDVLKYSEKRMRAIRGRRIGMVFQEPMTALNPVMRIGEQIAEGPRYHLRMSHGEAMRHAEDLLKQVGIPDAAKRLRDYPHQFSGGMRQRVVIAIALSCHPEIIIADEPTTALDVTVQAQILDLLAGLAKQTHAALMLITHNLGIVARYADRVNVMYAGKVVETASGDIILQEPRHPYTKTLLQCVPRIDRLEADLARMPGSVPGPGEHLAGCSFRPRCPDATPECAEGTPPLVTLADGHQCACFAAKK